MLCLVARRCQNAVIAMMDLTEAKRILAALGREGVEYVLVGSMAMAAH
jgi:hypothetical protein